MSRAFQVFLSEEQIQSKVKELAEQINSHYRGEDLHVVGVLKGSFVFVADLIRHLDTGITIDFIKASSYGEGTESSGKVSIDLDIEIDIKDKNVLIVEDIVDTGTTMSVLLDLFQKRNPKSLKLASLLHKPSRTQVEIEIDFLGFEIEDKFVIGYGLDLAQKYRELPYIGLYES